MNTNLIITSVATVVATSEAKVFSNGGKLTMEPVVGGFIVGIFLFALDEVSPEVAKWFAILVLVGALLRNGTFLLKMVPGQK